MVDAQKSILMTGLHTLMSHVKRATYPALVPFFRTIKPRISVTFFLLLPLRSFVNYTQISAKRRRTRYVASDPRRFCGSDQNKLSRFNVVFHFGCTNEPRSKTGGELKRIS